LFAIATLACSELTISKAHANMSFDGAWSVQITMDQGATHIAGSIPAVQASAQLPLLDH
jgi:hypothetical protein